MARKFESFKTNEKKKTITIYTNVEADAAEKEIREWYLSQGYRPMKEEKKAGVTVEEMRAELEKDKAALEAFNTAYAEKERGFFKACKIYMDWKKKNK